MQIEGYYNKKRIFVNGISSLIQVIITALTYFFLYKYLYKYLGADQLGLWSLILATTSIVSLGGGGYRVAQLNSLQFIPPKKIIKR